MSRDHEKDVEICRRNAQLQKERCAAQTHRRCAECEQRLPKTSEYFRATNDKGAKALQYVCLQCEKVRQRRYSKIAHQNYKKRHRETMKARKQARRAQNPAIDKARRMKKQQRRRGVQVGSVLRCERLARRVFPEMNECRRCGKEGKTRLFYPFGRIAWFLAERVCNDCFYESMTPYFQAIYAFAKMISWSDEDRDLWNKIHRQHVVQREVEDAELARVRAQHGEAYANVFEKFQDWEEPHRTQKVLDVLKKEQAS